MDRREWERRAKPIGKQRKTLGVEKVKKVNENPHFIKVCDVVHIGDIRMLGVKEILGLSIISLLVTAISSSTEDISDEIYDRPYNVLSPKDARLQYLIETNKRSFSAIKRLVDELESNFGKRTACLIDGGLSSACRNQEMLEAMDRHRFLSSSLAPGRRRRRNIYRSPDYQYVN